MDFKEMRNLAISLYKQGKTEEEIQTICKVPINKETIGNWMQEDEEKNRLKAMSKLTKKMKKIKKIDIKEKNKKEIVEQLKEISFEILKIDADNEIAMNELVRCYSIQKEYDIGRTYGEKILKNSPNNIFALYNMARLEMAAGNTEKAREYNGKLLEIDSDNKQGNIQKTIIQERIFQENQKKRVESKRQQESKIEINTEEIATSGEIEEAILKPKTIEEQQLEFAKMQMQKEKYTLENQKIYMEKLQKMFYNGKINKKNIEEVRSELYKYPDKIESAIFLSEIYSFITEREERGIEEINNYIDTVHTLSRDEYKILDEKIKDFRDRIDFRDMLKQKEIERQRREKELKAEQREYSRQIIKMIDTGELRKEDIPEIVSKLEKYPDRSKAIFLIMKLYEGYGNREESLKFLAKYSTITNLSNEEKDNIIKMRKIVLSNNKEDVIAERQKRVKARIKQRNRKYKKQVDKDLIRKMIIEGNTVEEIYKELAEKGDNTSLKSIAKIKSHLVEKEPELQKKDKEEIELAKIFLQDGKYSIEQVYELLGYNIGKNRLIQIKEQIKIQNDSKMNAVEGK